MAKVKVIRKFRDKEDKKIYQKGDIRTISKERLEEIQKAGKYVEVIPEEPEKEPEPGETVSVPGEGTEQIKEPAEKKAAKTTRKKS